MTLKLLFTAFLLDSKHQRDSVENKPACLRVELVWFVCNINDDVKASFGSEEGTPLSIQYQRLT